MTNENYGDILEDLYDANMMLEVCQGYTQADAPKISVLSDVLYKLAEKYTGIYLRLACNDDYRTETEDKRNEE